MTAPAVTRYGVARLTFDAGQPYEKFRARYEAAVPARDPQQPGAAAGRHTRLNEISARASARSPYGFVLHWRAETVPRMTDAGEQRPGTAYLMGSDAMSERLYLRNPAMMLYVPLRALIYIGAGDRTRFAVDQPSTLFSGFADPDIAAAGRELDRRLAGLLGALGITAGRLLRAAARPVTAAVNGHEATG
jgi:hypothetical protein